MSPPSYAHRHILCSELLASRPAPPDHSPFSLGWAESSKSADVRSRKLDHLLLQGWAGKGKGREAAVDDDTLQRAENLRIKRADFEALGRVGEGQFGVVDAVRCRFDGKVYAMKTMEKYKVQRAGAQLSLPAERHLHIAGGSSESRRVPGLIAAFQTPTSLVMVTDYAPCGTLWDRLACAPDMRLSEREVRWWTAQMADAISWCHQQGFAHRDIKPHNCLLHANGVLWLTDFGSSAPLLPSFCLHKSACLLPCGTADYIAPEILAFAEQAFLDAMSDDPDKTIKPGEGYTALCDWWSLGAVVYELVIGTAPFWAKRVEETYQRIMRYGETLVFDTVKVSESFEMFIRSLLCPAEDRLNYQKIRLHPWLVHPDISKPVTLTTPLPQWLAPLEPIDLTSLLPNSTDDETMTQGFDQFFQSSPGLSSMSISTRTHTYTQQSPIAEDDQVPLWYRWLGWSWDPPPSAFARTRPAPGSASSVLPKLTSHRGTPTPSRTRPVSDPKIFRQLVDCVQMSARKKFVEASAKKLGASRGRWEPPTPSPMPRLGSLRGAKMGTVPREAATRFSEVTRPSTAAPTLTPVPTEPRSMVHGPVQGQNQTQGHGLGAMEALMEKHRGLNRQLDDLEHRLQTLKAGYQTL